MKIKLIYQSFLFAGLLTIGTQSGFSQNKEEYQKEEITLSDNGTPANYSIQIHNGKVLINGKEASAYPNAKIRITHSNDTDSNMEDPYDEDGEDFNNTLSFSEPANRFFNHQAHHQAELGVMIKPDEKGARIAAVLPHSSAEEASLQINDIIIAVEDRTIYGPEDLITAIHAYKPGDKIRIDYLRDGQKQQTEVVLKQSKKHNSFSVIPNQDGNRQDFSFKPFQQFFAQPFRNFNDFDFPFIQRTQIGLKIQDMDAAFGVKVLDVKQGSDAEKAGFQKGDIILEINHETINKVEKCRKILSNLKEGEKAIIKISRNGEQNTLTFRIPKPLEIEEF